MRGFSLIEIIVYIAILSLLTVVTVQTLIIVGGSISHIRTTRALDAAAAIAMDRMIRVVRDATAVNEGLSAFDNSPGVLSLTGSESPALTHQFSISGGGLELINGSAGITLTPPGVMVSSLIFRLIATTTSEAIKIELILATSNGRATTTQNFYGTAILRNSYAE